MMILAATLVAPHCATFRYYRCDTPYRAIPFQGRLALPQNGAIPPQRTQFHICAIPHFATYHAMIVRYPIKTNTKEFCDTIAASIARYDKHRCCTSKAVSGLLLFNLQTLGIFSSIDVPWQEPVKTLLRLTRLLSFDLDLLQAGCVVGVNPVRSCCSLLDSQSWFGASCSGARRERS